MCKRGPYVLKGAFSGFQYVSNKSECAKNCPKLFSKSWRNHFSENLFENPRKKIFSVFLPFFDIFSVKKYFGGFLTEFSKK